MPLGDSYTPVIMPLRTEQDKKEKKQCTANTEVKINETKATADVEARSARYNRLVPKCPVDRPIFNRVASFGDDTEELCAARLLNKFTRLNNDWR